VIWRTLFQILITGFFPRQQHLPVRWNFQIMRSVHVFQNLLRNPREHWRGDLAALMQSHRRVEHDRHGDGRVIHRRESRERRHVLGV
jgi:hypothetical protein